MKPLEQIEQIEKECQEKIEKMGNVCDRCGRKIVPIKTKDNSGNLTYWPGCFHGEESGNFTNGVKQEVFELASRLVLDGETYYSSDVVSKTDNKEYWFQLNVRGFCNLLKKIKYLEKNNPRFTKEQL